MELSQLGYKIIDDIRHCLLNMIIFLIKLYQNMISPLRLPTCRFMPTCSQYAIDALTAHGLFYGGYLTVARLLKCGPWHQGGWDPVPERSEYH